MQLRCIFCAVAVSGPTSRQLCPSSKKISTARATMQPRASMAGLHSRPRPLACLRIAFEIADEVRRLGRIARQCRHDKSIALFCRGFPHIDEIAIGTLEVVVPSDTRRACEDEQASSRLDAHHTRCVEDGLDHVSSLERSQHAAVLVFVERLARRLGGLLLLDCLLRWQLQTCRLERPSTDIAKHRTMPRS